MTISTNPKPKYKPPTPIGAVWMRFYTENDRVQVDITHALR